MYILPYIQWIVWNRIWRELVFWVSLDQNLWIKACKLSRGIRRKYLQLNMLKWQHIYTQNTVSQWTSLLGKNFPFYFHFSLILAPLCICISSHLFHSLPTVQGTCVLSEMAPGWQKLKHSHMPLKQSALPLGLSEQV